VINNYKILKRRTNPIEVYSMALTEKLNVLEIVSNLLKEHEKKLDQLILKIEIVDQTIKQDKRLSTSLHEYERHVDSSQKILVVDDDETLGNTFKLILEGVGYTVDTANIGYQAISMANKRVYDLVILDLNLPDMLGDEVAERIKEVNSSTDVIYITGYSMLKNNLKNDGEVLMKPVTPNELVKIAKKKLDNQYQEPKII
jgi:CheY-like chemotaxis protein